MHLPAVRGRTDVCGCFPTGRHYPGIADLIADAIQKVEGLCQEFEPGSSWEDIPFVVIDFETTGRDSKTDRVIEIGLVTFEKGKVGSRQSLLVNPGIPVPEESRAVHGISDEELEGAPDFATVMPRVLESLQGKLPVAIRCHPKFPGQGIDRLGPYPVQPHGKLKNISIVLGAGIDN